jgi:hypothetical protein
MKQRELRKNEIGLIQVDNHLYYVLRRDMVNTNGEQLYKVGNWNSETNGFGLNKYALSFDNAIINLFSRVNSQLSKKFIYTEQENITKHAIDEIEINNENMLRKYIREKLRHYIGLMKEDMLSIEDIEETLQELI